MEMKMKKFTEAEIEIIKFGIDIITTSDEDGKYDFGEEKIVSGKDSQNYGDLDWNDH